MDSIVLQNQILNESTSIIIPCVVSSNFIFIVFLVWLCLFETQYNIRAEQHYEHNERREREIFRKENSAKLFDKICASVCPTSTTHTHSLDEIVKCTQVFTRTHTYILAVFRLAKFLNQIPRQNPSAHMCI